MTEGIVMDKVRYRLTAAAERWQCYFDTLLQDIDTSAPKGSAMERIAVAAELADAALEEFEWRWVDVDVEEEK